MGRGGGEGRIPSLMTAAVEREVSNSYFFSFFFDVSSGFSIWKVKLLIKYDVEDIVFLKGLWAYKERQGQSCSRLVVF
jgi:hypothetical protein